MTSYEMAFLERIEKQNLEILRKLESLSNSIGVLKESLSVNQIDHHDNDSTHDLTNCWCP